MTITEGPRHILTTPASELPAVPYTPPPSPPLHSAKVIGRQLAVLSLIAHGISDLDEIARRLDTDVITVKLHIVAIKRRFGTDDMAYAVFLACVYHLIPLNPVLPSIPNEYA